ncbi:uncharacterized protein LOC100679738 isoform X2 [Nasonia vitripennis]|uniref:Uncharacterized protein n=1 Tax=Nasonia vitripennis TaxID=7425 RepID=A0A7M7GFS3_NASVI|nr:uncharacterized protein LOC100679738 isoform X2 [Nasonia vitripennis]XP_032453363.1 uncharacterized protein LOC100679738 isoform X2 [Nasonia vitripennis]
MMKTKSLSLFGGLIIFCLMVDMAIAAPLKDDQDIIANSETRNYGFPFYWFVRPVYEDEDEDNGYRAPSVNSNTKNSAHSFVEVGSGWGR